MVTQDITLAKLEVLRVSIHQVNLQLQMPSSQGCLRRFILLSLTALTLAWCAQLHYIVKVPQGPLAWMPMPGADFALLLSHCLPHSVSHLRMWLNASALHILIPQQSPLSWLAG